MSVNSSFTAFCKAILFNKFNNDIFLSFALPLFKGISIFSSFSLIFDILSKLSIIPVKFNGTLTHLPLSFCVNEPSTSFLSNLLLYAYLSIGSVSPAAGFSIYLYVETTSYVISIVRLNVIIPVF